MAFFTLNQSNEFLRHTKSYAFGNLHSKRLTASQGSARWGGRATGATRKLGIPLTGGAQLNYDFSNNTLYLLVDMTTDTDQQAALPFGGISNYVLEFFEWSDLQVNADGSFHIPGYDNDKPNTGLHPTLGYVDGDFYGPNAEEFAGVFERQYGNDGDSIVGAFGGPRLAPGELE